MTTQRYTLGDQGKRGRRVWLDSATLLNNAGFTRGASYTKTFTRLETELWVVENAIVLEATAFTPKLSKDGTEKTFKVSGKGANPVIDITSKKVSKHLAGYDFVSVEFGRGYIVITGTD